MTKLSVVDWKNNKVSEVSLPEDVFNQEVKMEVLHSVVRWQLACRRQGTHMTKTKGLVSGGGKKPFKQKGTGNARQGSSRSPLMPGGGTMFGPAPRDYSYVLPKKVRKLGLRMALSYLNSKNKLVVVNEMTSEGKTKELASRFNKIGVSKALVIDANKNELFDRASKNISGIRYNSIEGLNVYDLLKYDCLVVTPEVFPMIAERCGVKNV